MPLHRSLERYPHAPRPKAAVMIVPAPSATAIPSNPQTIPLIDRRPPKATAMPPPASTTNPTARAIGPDSDVPMRQMRVVRFPKMSPPGAWAQARGVCTRRTLTVAMRQLTGRRPGNFLTGLPPFYREDEEPQFGRRCDLCDFYRRPATRGGADELADSTQKVH